MFGLQMIGEMEKMHHEMDQLLCSLGLGMTPEVRTDPSGFRVQDVGDSYRVEASLPGIDVEKLEIDVLGRRLSLSAERLDHDAGEDAVWHRRERTRKTFRKSFMLPAEIDSDKVEAEYQNGTLTISLPKAAAALPKKISVKAA